MNGLNQPGDARGSDILIDGLPRASLGWTDPPRTDPQGRMLTEARNRVMLPVSSFISEARRQTPEVAPMPCVNMAETAAEKLVALTRRTAVDLAGLSRDPDPTLVRHIYDLHMMHGHVDVGGVAGLARAIAETDAKEFASQYPAYVADIPGETRKAHDALRSDPVQKHRYNDFVTGMVYGEKPEYETALKTIVNLSGRFCNGLANGRTEH